MACLGYVIAIIGNNVMLVFIDVFLRIPRDVISEKYTFIYSMIYALLSYTGLCVLRKVIYSRKMVQRIFTEISSKVQLALVINIIIFLSIFLMNITLGEKVGYSKNMLMINSFLFFISLVIISWVLLNVAKSIEEEEKQKAKENVETFLKEILKKLSEDASYTINIEDETIEIMLEGKELGYLIGYRGETLYSLQNVLSAVAGKGIENRARVILDIAGYKDKREKH